MPQRRFSAKQPAIWHLAPENWVVPDPIRLPNPAMPISIQTCRSLQSEIAKPFCIPICGRMDDTSPAIALDTEIGATLKPFPRIAVLVGMVGRQRVLTLDQKLALVVEMKRCGNVAAFT